MDVAAGAGRREDHAALRARATGPPPPPGRGSPAGSRPAGSCWASAASEPVHAGRSGWRRSGAKISAISALSSVSLSSSSSTSASRTSRFCSRMSKASWCAVESSFLASSSMIAATSRSSCAGGPCRAQERLGGVVAELDRAEAVAHAVLRDHRAGEVGRLLDVVAGAAGDVVEDQRLGGHPAEHVGQLVEHLAARLAVLVLVGQHHRVAQRATARQDRHLVHRVGAGQRRGDEGVAALVVGRDQLLLLAHQAGAPLRAGDHAVDGLVEARVGDQLLVLARGEQRGLVEDVGQVGAGEAGRTASDAEQVDVGARSACRASAPSGSCAGR